MVCDVKPIMIKNSIAI